jgi:Glycosyltransferase family 87
VVVVPLRGEFLDNDLTLVYMAARIGLEHGWSHIYSQSLQHQVFNELRPHTVWADNGWFLNTPPYAWLVAPLTPLGPDAVVAIGLALATISLLAAWWLAAPGAGWDRRLWLLGALAWYPVLYALSLVQPDFLVLLIAAAAWKLAESKRPWLAGAVLGLSAIKPQLTLLLPLVLLTSGRWRIVAGWAAVAGSLGLLALISLGSDGLHDYRTLLGMAQEVANNRYFTPAYLLGPGPASYVASGLVIAIAAAGGYLNRHAGDARIFALGVVATTIGATYWHLQDYTVLVLAAWLFWREAAPAWQRAWLLVVVVGGELAWAVTPLPVLIGVAGWFIFLVTRPRPSRVTT